MKYYVLCVMQCIMLGVLVVCHAFLFLNQEKESRKSVPEDPACGTTVLMLNRIFIHIIEYFKFVHKHIKLHISS